MPGDPSHTFMKITLADPKLVRDTASLFDRGLIEGLAATTTFEATLDYNLRFMCDIGIVGCSWVELPCGKYNIRRTNKKSSAQIEVEIDVR